MSKEIIDKIKQAEASASAGLTEAGENADKLVKEAKEAAAKLYESEIKKARDAAAKKISEAEVTSEEVVKQAEAKAIEAKDAMKNAAAAKQEEAVREVINSLL